MGRESLELNEFSAELRALVESVVCFPGEGNGNPLQ